MDRETREFYDGDPQGYSDNTVECDVSDILGRFASHLNPGSRVLDLGCGSGRDTIALRSMGFSVVPVDGSQGMCLTAERNTGDAVRRLDMLELDYEGEFDGVWACASMLHLREGEIPRALALVRRALRDGGVLYVSFKDGTFSGRRDGRWYTDMTPGAMTTALTSAGFVATDVWHSVDRRGTVWANGLFSKGRAGTDRDK